MQVVNSAGDCDRERERETQSEVVVVQQLAVNPFYTVDWMPDSSGCLADCTLQHSTAQQGTVQQTKTWLMPNTEKFRLLGKIGLHRVTSNNCSNKASQASQVKVQVRLARAYGCMYSYLLALAVKRIECQSSPVPPAQQHHHYLTSNWAYAQLLLPSSVGCHAKWHPSPFNHIPQKLRP